MTHEDPRQLSALKLYEKATSEEREAMRISILPGREPPSAGLSTPQPVVPLASDSQLLPTDPEAINYPNKTLVSVSATCGLATGERREQRAEDARYCAKHFAGHVVLSPLDVVLARLGSSALVDKLAELKKVARTQLNATLKDAVLANLSTESIPSSKPADRVIDNRYWLSRLADAALKPAADSSPLVVDYFPTPAEKLPEQEQHGYKKTRKYDASLRPSAAEVSTTVSLTSSSTSSSPKPTHRLSPLTPSSVRASMWPSTSRLSPMRTTF
ncbi:hypothetical protein DFH09DRAFT_197201 [Mycena vulgaris]|nr:hypothetical protein DFH09DRAFT_197201 [Mycena vulgaris]